MIGLNLGIWQSNTPGDGGAGVSAPTAAGNIADQTFTRSTGVQTVQTAQDFTGSGLTYSLTTTTTGVTINSTNGVVSVDTAVATVQSATSIVVRATNSAGNASSGFSLTVNAAQVVTFGALTPVGAGGVATALSNGDYGEFTASGGVLTPRVSPLTVGVSAEAGVTVVADTRTVSTSAELQATYPGTTGTALQGKTVALRDGDYDVGTLAGFDGTLSDYVTWQGASGDRTAVKIYRTVSGRKAEIVLNGAGSKFLALDTLTVEYEQVAATVGNGSGSKVGLLRIQNGGDFKVNNCVLAGDLLPWQEGGVPRQEHAGVFATNVSNIEVTNSDISGFVHGVNMVSVTNLTVTGNEIHDFWGDAGQLLGDTPGPAINYGIRNNLVYNFVGTYSYLHQDMLQTFNEGLSSATSDFLGLEIAGNIVFPGTKTLLAGPLMLSGITRPASTYNGTYITSDTTFTGSDVNLQYEVMATGGDVTITLPAASGYGSGDRFVVVRHPQSDSNVIVTFNGSDTMEGSGADVVLTNTGPVHCTARGTNTSDWDRFESGNNIQGLLIQDLSELTDLPRFYDLHVHGNIIIVNNANGMTLGNNTRSIVQSGRSHNNTVIELYPSDVNGDGVIDAFDGLANSSPRIRTYGTDNMISYRDIASSFLFEGPNTDLPKVLQGVTYASHNQAAQAALFSGQDGTSPVNPTTRAEAIALARVAAGSAAELSSGVYAGAVGTSDTDGYWNFTTNAPNAGYSGAPTVTSSSFADGALAITFDMPIEFGTGDVVLRRNGGSGFADHETFSIATDVEDVLGDSVGTAGRMHLEGNTLVVVPADVSAGGTFALRIAGTAIDSVYGDSFAGIADDTSVTFTVAASGITPALVDLQGQTVGQNTTRTFSVNFPSAGPHLFAFMWRESPNDEDQITAMTVNSAAATAVTFVSRAQQKIKLYSANVASAGTFDVTVTQSRFLGHGHLAVVDTGGGSVASTVTFSGGGGGSAVAEWDIDSGAGRGIAAFVNHAQPPSNGDWSIVNGFDAIENEELGSHAVAVALAGDTASGLVNYDLAFSGSNQDTIGLAVVLEA